jgi:hypothetical protein
MKEIKFKLGDQVLSGQLGSRIEKKTLYGYSRRVAEKDGKILSRGALSADGRLLRRDEIAVLKIDPDGTPVDEIMTELDGALAELKPSVFERDNLLEEVPLIRLASFTVSDVYPLDELGLKPGLYSTEFSYRKSLQPKEALLLVKAGQGFLLVGEAKQTTLVGLSVAYSFFDTEEEEAEEGEELDFAMV